MSTDPSQVKVVLTASSGLEKGDSSRTSMYQILVQNPQLFWDRLRGFFKSSERNFKIPIVCGDRLDLHQLFCEVTCRGGLEMVIKDRRCKEVMEALQFKGALSNAAAVLRKNYRKMLFAFEHVYYFQAPLDEFPGREKALMRLVEKSANRDDKDVEEAKPGLLLNGVIDGKFDGGYLVTVKIGSEELKGVLYHMPDQAPPETQRRRKNKRAKTSHHQEGPQLPKPLRSAYNFFFSEQYAKLKAEFGTGPKGSLTKKIGSMWSNLSESDKQGYIEKFLEKKKLLAAANAAEYVAATIKTETEDGTNAVETGAETDTTETVAATDAAETVAGMTNAMETVAATDAPESVAGTEAADIVAEMDAAASTTSE
ncbi:hypothetical protein CARUB_v10006957mg [Capsella rubella]|uniref:HMG box domain-containing protein n=1 Tax=Capsella rubella TaxID=81985 RepID=R0GNH8_9BRAS|nr:putative high mobility group B protein 11 [Capsella rubella]EOA18414.1 hypothetical protein CARUB_v10006957mg [Capsella rubella]